MFDTIKLYGAAALAIIVAAFLAVFKYRGMKIDSQEAELEDRKEELEEVVKYHENKDKVQSFEKDNAVAAAKTGGDRFGTPYVNDGSYTL